VTLYEACALGVAVVAVALNPYQHVTIRAMARRGAAIDGGRIDSVVAPGKAAVASAFSRKVESLFTDAAARRRLSSAGRTLVDGQGAFRVAQRLRELPRLVRTSGRR
jgi:spore coat polysaccharide biosynthesis predicted glycosyltransferase SpsG